MQRKQFAFGDRGQLLGLDEKSLVGGLAQGRSHVDEVALHGGKANHRERDQDQRGAGEPGADDAPVHVVQAEGKRGAQHAHLVDLRRTDLTALLPQFLKVLLELPGEQQRDPA